MGGRCCLRFLSSSVQDLSQCPALQELNNKLKKKFPLMTDYAVISSKGFLAPVLTASGKEGRWWWVWTSKSSLAKDFVACDSSIGNGTPDQEVRDMGSAPCKRPVWQGLPCLNWTTAQQMSAIFMGPEGEQGRRCMTMWPNGKGNQPPCCSTRKQVSPCKPWIGFSHVFCRVQT